MNAQHITSSVFINDDESGLHHDYEVWLERLAPHAPIEQYWHNRTDETFEWLECQNLRRLGHFDSLGNFQYTAQRHTGVR